MAKAYSGLWVWEEGPYSKTEKWNLLHAIYDEDRTSENDARWWTDIWIEGGTTVFCMMKFIHDILQDIGPAYDQIFSLYYG